MYDEECCDHHHEWSCQVLMLQEGSDLHVWWQLPLTSHTASYQVSFAMIVHTLDAAVSKWIINRYQLAILVSRSFILLFIILTIQCRKVIHVEDSPINFPKIKEFKCCYKLFANNKSNSFQCCKVVISVSFKLCTVCLDLKQLHISALLHCW